MSLQGHMLIEAACRFVQPVAGMDSLVSAFKQSDALYMDAFKHAVFLSDSCRSAAVYANVGNGA